MKSGCSLVTRYDYRYDKAGNRTSFVDHDGGRVTFVYDRTYQLLTERRTLDAPYSRTFTYDAAGNRQRSDDAVDLTTYTYDAADRLRRAETVSGFTTYTYDADGNQRRVESSSGALTTNTWDYENQNTQVEQPAGQLFTYVYNNDLLKVAYRDDIDAVTSYVWDKKNVIQETDDASVVQADYTYEPLEHGNLVSQRRFGSTTFHHYDALGSTVALTDGSQVVSDEFGVSDRVHGCAYAENIRLTEFPTP